MENTNSIRKLSRSELKRVIGGTQGETTCTAKCSNKQTLTCTGYHVYCTDYSNCSSNDINGNNLEYRQCEEP